MACARHGRFSFVISLCMVARASVSTEWGADGSSWTGPEGRLSDYSHAGYEYGELAFPSAAVDVTADSLTGDGSGDNTAALQAAIDATPEGGVLFIPAGRFVLDSPVYLTRSIVLRGAGKAETIIAPSRSLFDVYGKGTCTAGTNQGYGWCRGFIELTSATPSSEITPITAAASRGAVDIVVVDASALTVGEEIAIVVEDPGTTLYEYFLGGVPPAENKSVKSQVVAKVTSVDVESNVVGLSRSLPFDIRLEWAPVVKTIQTLVERVGIEHLAVELPSSPAYPGHHVGAGYNAIELSKCRHCFITDVRIANADLAINLRHSDHSTVANVVLTGTRGLDSRGLAGHHGIDLTGSTDILVTSVEFEVPFVHDVTVDGRYGGNVITGIWAVAFSADHHGNAPSFNLWDDILTQDLSRVWVSGGSGDVQPHSGRGEVFWNVRSEAGKFLASQPSDGSYHDMLITPFGSSAAPAATYMLEALPGPMTPSSLYRAQLERRLTSAAPPLSFTPPRRSDTPLDGMNGGACRPVAGGDADPTCSTGILSGSACCSASCGACGGTGCGSFPGGSAACCTGSVLAADVSCDTAAPPCVVASPPAAVEACNVPLECTDGMCSGGEEPVTTGGSTTSAPSTSSTTSTSASSTSSATSASSTSSATSTSSTSSTSSTTPASSTSATSALASSTSTTSTSGVAPTSDANVGSTSGAPPLSSMVSLTMVAACLMLA